MNRPASQRKKSRSGGSVLEWDVRTELTRRGLRFEVDVRSLPGRPDLVFRPEKIAVFLDGCFWHGCPDHTSPKLNADWRKKQAANRARGKAITNALERDGWQVLRFWEHESLKEIADTISSVKAHRNFGSIQARVRQL